MPRTIYLNGYSYSFGDKNLPCLVTYKEGDGGSQMSMTLAADLFLRGCKLLLFTAYPMAKENFLSQIIGEEDKVVYVEKEEDLSGAYKYQAVIIQSGNEELCAKFLVGLPDINDRVVLIKNIEVYSEKFVSNLLSLQTVILSGDIDKSAAKIELTKKEYKTFIIFSKPETDLPVSPPGILEKYSAYMWNETGESGVVKVGI